MKIGSIAAMLVLTASSALAQPILIPLEPQPKPDSRPPPVAPPVAPPIAGPSQPETNTATARGEDAEHPEEAYQPPPKR